MTLAETLAEIQRLTDEAKPASERLAQAQATADELADAYNATLHRITELRKEAWRKFADENFPPVLEQYYRR